MILKQVNVSPDKTTPVLVLISKANKRKETSEKNGLAFVPGYSFVCAASCVRPPAGKDLIWYFIYGMSLLIYLIIL